MNKRNFLKKIVITCVGIFSGGLSLFGKSVEESRICRIESVEKGLEEHFITLLTRKAKKAYNNRIGVSFMDSTDKNFVKKIGGVKSIGRIDAISSRAINFSIDVIDKSKKDSIEWLARAFNIECEVYGIKGVAIGGLSLISYNDLKFKNDRAIRFSINIYPVIDHKFADFSPIDMENYTEKIVSTWNKEFKRNVVKGKI